LVPNDGFAPPKRERADRLQRPAIATLPIRDEAGRWLPLLDSNEHDQGNNLTSFRLNEAGILLWRRRESSSLPRGS